MIFKFFIVGLVLLCSIGVSSAMPHNQTDLLNYTYVPIGPVDTTNMTIDQAINATINILLFVPESLVSGIMYVVGAASYFMVLLLGHAAVFRIVADIFTGLPPVVISVLVFSLFVHFIGNVLLGLRM